MISELFHYHFSSTYWMCLHIPCSTIVTMLLCCADGWVVIFSCYVAVVMHYSEGVYHYSNIAVALTVVPVDATSP